MSRDAPPTKRLTRHEKAPTSNVVSAKETHGGAPAQVQRTSGNYVDWTEADKEKAAEAEAAQKITLALTFYPADPALSTPPVRRMISDLHRLGDRLPPRARAMVAAMRDRLPSGWRPKPSARRLLTALWREHHGAG